MRFRRLIRAAKSGLPLVLMTLAADPVFAQFRELTADRGVEIKATAPQLQLAPTRQPFVTPRGFDPASPAFAVPEPIAETAINIHSVTLKPTGDLPNATALRPQPQPVGVQISGEPTLAELEAMTDIDALAPSKVVNVKLNPQPSPAGAVPADSATVAAQPTLAGEAPQAAVPVVTIAPPSTVVPAEQPVQPPAETVVTAEPSVQTTTAEPAVETQTAGLLNSDPENPFAAFTADPNASRDGGALTSVVDDSDSPAGLVVASPVQFNRVTPGTTTKAELASLWGEPAKMVTANGETREIFLAPGFAQVDLSLVDDVVESTLVHLATPVTLGELETSLDLADVRPVKLDDADGQPLGFAYPERGVLLTFAPGSEQQRVSHVLLEPIRGELYRLRAELDQRRDYSRCLADLEEAVRLDPQDARAYWLQAELLSWAGLSDDAMDCARVALRIEPENALYQLTKAKFDAAAGDRDGAIASTKAVVDGTDASEIVRARANYQLGNLTVNGETPDFQNGLSYHMKAVDLAAKYLNDSNHDRRRMAKDIVVDAHLAVAQDIALGNFQRQREVVPKWLTRATDLAEAFITEDGGDPTRRMEIYRTTLAAYSVLDGNFDASIATEEALKESRRLIADADDRMYQSYVERELAETLYHAAKIEHRCGRFDDALRYANNAVVLIDASDQSIQRTAFDRLIQGQLYFFTGSLYAVHKQDHAEATKWYDKSLPAFDDQRLVDLVDVSAFGEMFVSMGVSYWENGGQDKAIQLTQTGAELMQQGVQAGTVDLIALSVPYGNLAAMHGQNGNAQQATHFAQLMAKVEQDGVTR